MDYAQLHRRARERGANRVVLAITRALVTPFCLIYLRMQRIGREHIPASGPAIIAANHRSFLDPFAIGTMTRRPIYYVAKKEIFQHRLLAWFLNALGAFPVDRGASDAEMLRTARAILARGDIVLIFPEGTRTRPGPLGRPKRGVGRLALESGAPVIPVAIHGTEAVRRGWRIRPHKVRVRAGRPLRYPRVETPSPALAAAVTERIWPCVMLQWEWLGGLPAIRRAAIIGAGRWGTSLAVCLARAGLEVELGCRTAAQAVELERARENRRHLPGVRLPDSVSVRRAADLQLAGHDLVCLAVAAASLPALMATTAQRVAPRAGILVVSRGLVAPTGTLPSVFVSQHTRARALAVLGEPSEPAELLAHGASVVLACAEGAFARQLADVLSRAGLEVVCRADLIGVQFAALAKNVATLAAAAAAGTGAGAALAAAGEVLAEVAEIAQAAGALPQTFWGLAGADELVGTLPAAPSRERRAGELVRAGIPAQQISEQLGGGVAAIDDVALLVALARSARVEAPALALLEAVLQGQTTPERWVQKLLRLSAPAAGCAVRAA
jgi:glycerol-3-phosphate dehydrogenase (NAD(P)+)